MTKQFGEINVIHGAVERLRLQFGVSKPTIYKALRGEFTILSPSLDRYKAIRKEALKYEADGKTKHGSD